MSGLQCLRCPTHLHRAATRNLVRSGRYAHTAASNSNSPPLDVKELLSKPSWSVRSLLPSKDAPTPGITPEKLHHLLRLSALPQPESAEEEEKMLETLRSQLHFVKEIQSVDTTGIVPLQAIRDETTEARTERTVGLKKMWHTLERELVTGRNKRPRRMKDVVVERTGRGKWDAESEAEKKWDVLGTAGRTEGGYFVVESEKES